eukprot:2816080-Amphidinium_carterae.1
MASYCVKEIVDGKHNEHSLQVPSHDLFNNVRKRAFAANWRAPGIRDAGFCEWTHLAKDLGVFP